MSVQSYLRRPSNFSLLLLASLLAFGCGDDDTGVDAAVGMDATTDLDSSSEDQGSADTVADLGSDATDNDRDNPTWTRESHENGVDPDYETVFPNDAVQRIDITISADNWAAMQGDLDANLGGNANLDFTPIWSEATLAFNGAEWKHVGIRYKGNSSLQNAVREGGDKFPYKLDFDEWEDTYETVDNQRFFGFKQLNLGTNFRDGTGMREKVASDLFRDFGVPSAHAAFCEVYLDRGNGSDFVGVYTLVEEVDDTVYENQFSSDEGNLYKPDGDAASFAQGTFDTSEMDLKTNEDDADFADVTALYDILHDPRRISEPDAWVAALEAVFDVDGFLRYLAVNQVIQNWDTYGQMTHNFFLYGDEDGVLTWIPWDNNEALPAGGGGGRRGPLSLTLDEVTATWPIIRYILDVEAYRTQYIALTKQFVAEYFNTARMSSIYDAYEVILEPAAGRENRNFASDVAALRTQVGSRESAVNAL